MLADAATALDAAWLLTLAAAWRKQRGLPFTRQAAKAKLFATERANEICDRARADHWAGTATPANFPSSGTSATCASPPSTRARARSSGWSSPASCCASTRAADAVEHPSA